MNEANTSKRETPLSETGRCILDTFERVLPQLNILQQARLLGLAEGLEYKNQNQSA